MQSPQINISIVIDPTKVNEYSSDQCIDSTLAIVNSIAHKLHSKGNQIYFEAPRPVVEPPPTIAPSSRHYQAVKASQRITDAIEFINKEIRLLKGGSESEIKTLQEVKRILLDM